MKTIIITGVSSGLGLALKIFLNDYKKYEIISIGRGGMKIL
jgi:short-subunit dehydrogenase involved in D-alanine esterification of teichoic acids